MLGYSDIYRDVQTRLDPNSQIDQMMREDLMQAQMRYEQYATTYATQNLYKVPPDIFRGYDMRVTTNCYCKKIPERLKDYYSQLLEYHRQAGYWQKELEKTCCALKKLGIKY